MTSKQQRETPCPICQQQFYTWGTNKAFRLSTTFPDSPRFLGLVLETRVTPIRRCNSCGNLQWFTHDGETKT